MEQNRIIELEAVHNFRDYGGYRTGEGRLRRGVLWRSGQYGDATDTDLAQIDALGLATIVDLRGSSERQAKPCRRGAGFAAEVLHHDGETAGLALHVEAAEGVLDEAGARRAMRRLYAQIAHRENLLPMLRRYFAALAERDGASLIHCLAGKDRTGFAVALLQLSLGVHRDDVMADYLLTNTAGNIDRRIAAGAEAIRERHGEIDEATIRALMGVEPEYLDAALAAVDAHPGGLDGYLSEVIELDPARREALRRRLVEA